MQDSFFSAVLILVEFLYRIPGIIFFGFVYGAIAALIIWRILCLLRLDGPIKRLVHWD